MHRPAPRRLVLLTSRPRPGSATATVALGVLMLLPFLALSPASAESWADQPGVSATVATAARSTVDRQTVNRARPWPGAKSTGVPAGTRLRPYTGPCTITRTQTIDGVDATGRCDAILVRAANVVISNSLVPRIDATEDGSNSVTVRRSTVRGGDWSDGAIWGYNIVARRVNVTGGQHSFHCAGGCTLVNSWLHAQYNPDGQSYHNNAFISNGGSRMRIHHNRLACTAQVNETNGGCTADLSLFGDFDPIRNVTITNNLFVANPTGISYCLYGGYDPNKPYGEDPTGIVVKDNVFQRGANRKCGVWGPVTSFHPRGTGNTWQGNRWDGGGVVHSG
ncbi:hypothetical protein HIDPHFAB_00045 [Nocardioides sp. T2.26MG-1]|nr:hypothetical protein HIDPHFAB_00045 [Nocardioides sp. T2.26MG-1]